MRVCVCVCVFSRAEGNQLAVLTALTQDQVVSKVQAGENKGRTLVHYAVTRAFAQTMVQRAYPVRRSNDSDGGDGDRHLDTLAPEPVGTTMHLAVSVEDGAPLLQIDKMRLVVYVQEVLSMRVLGVCTLKMGMKGAPEDARSVPVSA